MGVLGVVLMLSIANTLLHHTNYVHTVNQNPSAGIPFNLPDMSYCQSCITHGSHLSAEPLGEMDRICRDYVSDVCEKKTRSFVSKRFMSNLRKLPSSQNAFIFYWALKARVSYEVVFRAAYTYRILVEAEPDDYENCITLFTDGSGFVNTEKPENIFEVYKCVLMYHTTDFNKAISSINNFDMSSK